MEEAIGVGRFHRYVIEPQPEGVYLFIFEKAGSSFPEKDFLEDSKEVVKEICKEDYGVSIESWGPYHGDSLR
ncbi:MAG: hypothetical protein AAF067_05435 [Pseudomonadota bacterium]